MMIDKAVATVSWLKFVEEQKIYGDDRLSNHIVLT